MITALLIICFLPALLVFGFVKLFKKQLAGNPTKKQMIKYVAIYLVLTLLVLGIYLILHNLAYPS